MASVNLTSGAISKISQGLGDKLQPVLQVVEIRLVNTQQSSAERYRMLLSDGVHHQQGMLATQMNGIVKSGQLQKGSIVQLNEFICNTIQNRRIIIIISLQVLVEKTEMIGQPKNYDAGNPISQSRAAGPGQQQQQQPDVDPRVNGQDAGQHALGDGNSPYTAPPSGGPLPATRNIHNASSPRTAAPGSFMDQKRFSGSSNSGGYQPPGSSYNSYPHPQPPPMYTANRGPIARNEAPARIIPIAALNPYQGKWTIKARVTAKSDVRHYNNARGEGKVFSFDLLDADGGEIRATCFNAVADQFYDQIEVGRVFLISKGALRPTQRSFNHLNSEYEIMLESTSSIQPCFEGDSIIPKQRFNFRSISEIESMENNAMADVIGIVTSINPAGTIMRKNGTETHKRTLQLKDMSGKSVEVTLWGTFCNAEGQKIQAMCDSGIFPALAIKAGRVSDFSGRSIGTITSSQLLVDPDIPEAHSLKDWYENEGKNHASASISREVGAAAGRMDARKTVSQIKDEGLGRSEKPDWITVKATVSFIKVDSFCYTACPLMAGDRQCNKKVNNNGDGTWHCDRCDRSFPECDYRYLLQFQMQDHTGVTWVTAFQECGEEILGVTAKELYLLKYEEQDEAKFAEIVRRVLFSQFHFKLKVKEETFSDEQRVKSTAVKADRVNPASECRFLLSSIERLSALDADHVDGHYGNNQYGTIGREAPPQPRPQPQQQPPLFCANCGSSGHSFQNCPRSMDRGSVSGTEISGNPSNVCFKCKQVGHWARDCPGPGSAMSSSFGGRNVMPSPSSSAGGAYGGRQYVGGF